MQLLPLLVVVVLLLLPSRPLLLLPSRPLLLPLLPGLLLLLLARPLLLTLLPLLLLLLPARPLLLLLLPSSLKLSLASSEQRVLTHEVSNSRSDARHGRQCRDSCRAMAGLNRVVLVEGANEDDSAQYIACTTS